MLSHLPSLEPAIIADLEREHHRHSARSSGDDQHDASSSVPDVFVSHFSGDKAILPAILKAIRDAGGSPYVDILDSQIESLGIHEYGHHFRHRIGACRRLIAVASDHTHHSKWVPWELGLGDGLLGTIQVAIWPVVTRLSATWYRQSYFAAYPVVLRGSDRRWNVCVDMPPFRPHKYSLEQWLRLTAPDPGEL